MTYPFQHRHTTTHTSGPGTPTAISVYSFTDKILITISQDGRLAQWFSVPLEASSTNHGFALPSGASDHDLLPDPSLTPRTLLGASTPEREALGQLFAVQISSALRLRDPGESRTVLLGLGLNWDQAWNGSDLDRELFFEVLEGVVRCL